MLIDTALKEWSVAVDALADGEMMMLLRKGGIKEAQGRFSARAENVLLFPTFEHQQPALLKPQYQAAVKPVTQGWHPQTITLKAWATVTDIFLTQDADKVAALSAFHIWQPKLAQARLKWKASQPLYVLALRTYRFAAPVEIPWQAEYGGCRSWIALASAQSVSRAVPALSDEAYQQQVSAIAAHLSG
ncbi:MAG: DUF1802 family protein [Cyanobacteria bacterium J06607_13]